LQAEGCQIESNGNVVSWMLLVSRDSEFDQHRIN
jgi:hypothetical protein